MFKKPQNANIIIFETRKRGKGKERVPRDFTNY